MLDKYDERIIDVLVRTGGEATFTQLRNNPRVSSNMSVATLSSHLKKLAGEYIKRRTQPRGDKMKTSIYSLLHNYQIDKYPEGYFMVSIDSEKYLLGHGWVHHKERYTADIGSLPETKKFISSIKRRKKELPPEYTITIRYKELVGGRPHMTLDKKSRDQLKRKERSLNL